MLLVLELSDQVFGPHDLDTLVLLLGICALTLQKYWAGVI